MRPQKSVLKSKVRKPSVDIPRPPLLVLLHGEGGNEDELFELFEAVDGRFVIISLKAPFMQSEKNYLWFTTTKYLKDYIANPAQLEYSRQQILNEISSTIAKYHCYQKQIYLFGFGQGGVMAMNIFLTSIDLIAGIVVSNGQLLNDFRTDFPPDEKFVDKSILITHGKLNQIYPIELGRKIKYELSGLPFEIDYQEYDIGHYYSKESINFSKEWLKARLDRAGVEIMPASSRYSMSLLAIKIIVSDLEKSINFYTRFLGMQLVERTGKGYAFLTNTQAHHVLELQLSNRKNASKHEFIRGIQSIKFELPDKVSFAEAYRNLKEGDVEVSTLDKIICWCMTFNDPDGNVIELILDTRQFPGRSNYWEGRELPLDESQILSE